MAMGDGWRDEDGSDGGVFQLLENSEPPTWRQGERDDKRAVKEKKRKEEEEKTRKKNKTGELSSGSGTGVCG